MSKIMGRFVEILGAFLENFQRKLKWIYTVRFMVSRKGNIENGGVALVWLIIFGLFWGILLYIRINKGS